MQRPRALAMRRLSFGNATAFPQWYVVPNVLFLSHDLRAR